MHVRPLVILFRRLSSLCMPALPTPEKKSVSFPCAQINHRSDQALFAYCNAFLYQSYNDLCKSPERRNVLPQRTLPLLTPCALLSILCIAQKDTAQTSAENRHTRTVNRLLVRVASRHRAKAAACRLESSRRAQKTTIIFMHLWRQPR